MYKNIVYTAKSLIRYVAHKLDFCIAAYAQIVGSAKRHISRLYAVVKVLSKLGLWLVGIQKKATWLLRLPLCGRWDLNPHDRIDHKILSLARLPVPTLPLNIKYYIEWIDKCQYLNE